MYVNPFPFGLVIGIVGTILVEIAIIVGCAIFSGRKK